MVWDAAYLMWVRVGVVVVGAVLSCSVVSGVVGFPEPGSEGCGVREVSFPLLRVEVEDNVVWGETVEELEDVVFDRPGVGALSSESVDEVVETALDIRGIDDSVEREEWKQLLILIGEKESGGQPGAINLWDDNAYGEKAMDGFPVGASRGWLQVVPDTFTMFHEPGTSSNIYDPVAQAVVVMKYVESRYFEHPGLWPESELSRRGAGNVGGLLMSQCGEYVGY